MNPLRPLDTVRPRFTGIGWHFGLGNGPESVRKHPLAGLVALHLPKERT
jgi:hypothetical protein